MIVIIIINIIIESNANLSSLISVYQNGNNNSENYSNDYNDNDNNFTDKNNSNSHTSLMYDCTTQCRKQSATARRNIYTTNRRAF